MVALGRHRKTDKPGDSGTYEQLTPEQKAKAFDAQAGRSVVRAADKRLKGEGSYSKEPDQGKSKKKWGKKS